MRVHIGHPLISVVAPRRSGHHAFVEWFCARRDRPTVFFNNVRPSSPPTPDNVVVFGAAGSSIDALTQIIQKSLRSHDLSFLADSAHYFMLNYEGISLENVLRTQSLLRSGADTRLLLFLRDPLNNFASLAKRIRSGYSSNTFQVYSQVLAFCEYVEALQQASPFDDVIQYSAWVSDEAYRAVIAERYGLRDSAANIEVPGFGGGSSFGGTTFDPVRQKQSLFSRWEEMKDDPLYLSFFADDQVADSVEQYFSMFGGREAVSCDEIGQLRRAARKNRVALRLAHIWLDGFHRLRRELAGIEAENVSILRKTRRTAVRGGILGMYALSVLLDSGWTQLLFSVTVFVTL
jgi:hypothetical protein